MCDGPIIGKQVRVRGTPFVGTVEDAFWRDDWDTMALVVMFDGVGPSDPPGGEFPAWRLGPAPREASPCT